MILNNNDMTTKEKIIEKLKQWIKDTDVISYEESLGMNVWDKEKRLLRDNKTEKEVYVVSFSTKSIIERDEKGEIISLMEGMSCFAYYDAETLELMYIHKKAGYIEKDGSY